MNKSTSPQLTTKFDILLESRLARVLHNSTLAWMFLICSLLLTLLGWYLSNQYAKERIADRFYFETEDIKYAITERMHHYEQALQGGVGLFAASDDVSREEWHHYVSALRLNENLPGIQGLGVSVRIPAAEKEAHLQNVRAEGFPDYQIKPDTVREEYHSIIYLEPFTGRNLRAFGFDMFSEPVRRAAMEQARDMAQATISGRVKLVQETEQNVQPGFLMYLPLYRKGLPTASVEQRRAALFGYVYSPFRTHDLMAGILGAGAEDLDFALYDGGQQQPESLLYTSSDAIISAARPAPTPYTRTETIKIGGHVWTISFQARPGFVSVADTLPSYFVAFGGLTIDLLLFYIIWSISALKHRAIKIAEQMTQELRLSQEQCEVMAYHAKESQQQMELVLHATRLSLWSWNIQTDEVQFTKDWAEFLGYTQGELPPHISTWENLVHPDDYPHTMQCINDCLHNRTSLFQVEHRLRAKNGEWRWMQCRGSVVECDDQQHPLRVCGTRVDITERKRQEAALRDSQLRLAGLIDSAMDAIISIDAEQRIVLFNAAAERMFGFTHTEMLGQSIVRLLPDSFREAHAKHIHNFSEAGITSRKMGALGTVSGLRQNGEAFPIEASISQTFVGSERLYTVILRDISQRLEVERLKREFISSVSHELRTPLTSIRGSLGLLTAGAMGELASDVQKMVELAERNSLHLLGLINDLLDLERLDQGQLEIHKGEVALQVVFQRALEAVQSFATEHEIKLELPMTVISVVGDENRLCQVMVNLLSNAIKFSPPHSRVTVAVVERSAEVEVQVIDRGRGIPPESQMTIFDRFQQVEDADTRIKGGAGLGLAICKGIIEQHEGQLGVISQPGEGSTFWFRLASGVPEVRIEKSQVVLAGSRG